MKKNKFYNKIDKQKRIEKKIERYQLAFQDSSIKATLDKLPKNQETLDVIEKELEVVVETMDGQNSREKWFNFNRGLDAIRPKK